MAESAVSAWSPPIGLRIQAFCGCNAIYATMTGLVLGCVGVPIYAFRQQDPGMPLYGVCTAIAAYAAFNFTSNSPFRAHGRKWFWFSKHAPNQTLMRRYLGFEVRVSPKVLEAQAKEGAQFVVTTGPHGVDSMFRVLLEGVLDEAFPKIHHKIYTLAASVLFFLPGMRELAMWTGCIDARRAVAEKVLKQGYSILLIPGGEAEQLMTEKGKEALYIKQRKGFIRLALKFNCHVVPGYVFGANDTFRTSRFLYSPRHMLMKSLGICIPLSSGVFGTMCPLPIKHTVCFGDPLKWKIANEGEPTKDEINAAHEEYMRAIVALFDEHKAGLGYRDRQLTLV